MELDVTFPLKFACYALLGVSAFMIAFLLAAFPVPGLRSGKYWAPVKRIDQVYGDRNFICTCPPMEAWSGEAANSPGGSRRVA